MVECLTRDPEVAGSSLNSFIALCPWARPINPSLVLVQPRKTGPDITEKSVDLDIKNQIKHTKLHILRHLICTCTACKWMGGSFQDYSWIQHFEADFPQKVIQTVWASYSFWLIFSSSKDNWAVTLKFLMTCRHTTSSEIWISKVQDFYTV